MGGGDGVDAHEGDHVGEAREQVAIGRDVGAQIGDGAHAQGEEASLGVEGQLRVADVVAGMLVGRNGLVTLAGPLHGAPELARGPQDEPVLGILPALGPEPAPDVARDDADLVLGDLEDHARQGVAHAVGILHVGVERVPVLAGIVDAERPARLHVLGVHAGDDVAPAHDVRRAREGGLHGGLVSRLVHVADIVGTLVPHRRASGPRRCRGGDRGKRIVVDLDEVGGVLGLGQGLGDHEGDGIADIAHALLREAAVGRGEHRRAVGPLAPKGHLHRAQAVALDVGAGEDGEDAGSLEGPVDVDGAYAGMGMRGAKDDGVRLPGKIDVVEITAFALEQADVLEARHRLADAELCHRSG